MTLVWVRVVRSQGVFGLDVMPCGTIKIPSLGAINGGRNHVTITLTHNFRSTLETWHVHSSGGDARQIQSSVMWLNVARVGPRRPTSSCPVLDLQSVSLSLKLSFVHTVPAPCLRHVHTVSVPTG